MQHPRFVSGDFNTGFIAEEFPKGFHASALVHDDPLLLAFEYVEHLGALLADQAHDR